MTGRREALTCIACMRVSESLASPHDPCGKMREADTRNTPVRKLLPVLACAPRIATTTTVVGICIQLCRHLPFCTKAGLLVPRRIEPAVLVAIDDVHELSRRSRMAAQTLPHLDLGIVKIYRFGHP